MDAMTDIFIGLYQWIILLKETEEKLKYNDITEGQLVGAVLFILKCPDFLKKLLLEVFSVIRIAKL